MCSQPVTTVYGLLLLLFFLYAVTLNVPLRNDKKIERKKNRSDKIYIDSAQTYTHTHTEIPNSLSKFICPHNNNQRRNRTIICSNTIYELVSPISFTLLRFLVSLSKHNNNNKQINHPTTTTTKSVAFISVRVTNKCRQFVVRFDEIGIGFFFDVTFAIVLFTLVHCFFPSFFPFLLSFFLFYSFVFFFTFNIYWESHTQHLEFSILSLHLKKNKK